MLNNKRATSKVGTVFTVLTLVAILGIILFSMGVIKTGSSPLAVTNGNTGNGNAGTNNNAGVGTINTAQPTATYSAIDKFSTSAITGTAYYKPANQKAQTTALSNVNSGTQYTYWVDNSTGKNYVKPAVFTAHSGANSIQAIGWQYAAPTITAYDNNAGTAITDASHNVTLSANGQANLDFKYQGTAKKSAGPFGGVMVLEYNSTISDVTCTGNDVLSANPYHVTYTVSNTADTFKEWAYSAGLDDGSGDLNHITCQFRNGATAQPAGGAFVLSFIPAGYYVTNTGNIVLDTEQTLNGATTRTGAGTQTSTFHFA